MANRSCKKNNSYDGWFIFIRVRFGHNQATVSPRIRENPSSLLRDKDKAVGKTLDKRARSPISPCWYSVLHNKPTYHTPIRPSDWSVLGLAVMAWTATMASLIRVWRSRNSVTCNNLIILAASLIAESEIKSIESRTLAKRYNFTVYRAGPTITGQVARESTW